MPPSNPVSPDTHFRAPAQTLLLAKACELAGLLHDLGKSTKRFQDKLDNGVKLGKGLGDPVRHEVVSVLMADVLLEALRDEDLDGLMCNPGQLVLWCDNAFSSELSKLGYSSADPCAISARIAGLINSRMSEARWAREHVVNTSTLWLVLSHHRQPQGQQGWKEPLYPGIQYKGAGRQDYFLKCRIAPDSVDDPEKTEDPFAKSYDIGEMRDNLKLYSGTQEAPAKHPWHDEQWLLKVIECYRALNQIFAQAESQLPDNALLENSEWATGLALMARTALVYGDYMISHEKVPGGSMRAPGAVYANTSKMGEQGVYADTLTKHLIGVGDRASQYFHDLFLAETPLIDSFPSLSLKERNHKLSGLNTTTSDARYSWQDKARETLSSHRSNDPFFGSVMGKTGAGKTRGNVMVMHAMKEDVRFTCAIGLRSLVAQTHKAYQEPFIGLDEDNVAILIGESLGSARKVSKEEQGTGNDLQADEEALLGDYVIKGAQLFKHPLSTLYDTHKQRSMLSQPVQVMTVDHIAPGAALGRSSELKLLLHLMATDIVLDEIDDYPVESQAALMRMAFISGFFGRSFVLSSATATPVIQKAFFDAWLCGYDQGGALLTSTQRPASPKAVLVSHVQGFEALVTQADSYEQDCDAFIDAVATEARRNARHRLEIIKINDRVTMPSPPGLENLYGARTLSLSQHFDLVGSILRFHRQFNVTEDGIRVSSGFVRFNNVFHAQHLALFLNQHEDENAMIIPVCYHAKMLAYERAQIESLLLELNCRKDKAGLYGEERILHHPAALEAIAKAKAQGKTDVIFVLATTSIIEVGRDHDYDWAILEPTSTRSLVQSCGRVWRHRIKALPEGLANVGVLETNILSTLKGMEKNPYVWVRHGIEDTCFPRDSKNPVVSLTIPVAKYAWKALADLGVASKPLTEATGRTGEGFKRMNAARTFWRKLLKTDGGLVHAGLCLEIPEQATDAFMGALELANQHIHLVGTGDDGFAVEYPAGKQFSSMSSARLCSHHADHRVLREPNSTVSLEYDADLQGVDASGQPKGLRWFVTNQLGEEKQQNIALGHIAPGNLWLPGSLEPYLAGGIPSRRAAKLSIRADEYRNISDFSYLFGVGWIKHF